MGGDASNKSRSVGDTPSRHLPVEAPIRFTRYCPIFPHAITRELQSGKSIAFYLHKSNEVETDQIQFRRNYFGSFKDGAKVMILVICPLRPTVIWSPPRATSLPSAWMITQVNKATLWCADTSP